MLAIGLVVDDAIVVVEAVTEIMDSRKLAAREATKAAMKEVAGPVTAIALVLVAVFVPVSFLGGLTGQFYRQFALTLAVSVIISAARRADIDAGAVRPAAQAHRSIAFRRSAGPRVWRVQSTSSGDLPRAIRSRWATASGAACNPWRCS